MRSDEVRARKTESGLVFLWILFLLVIMTTLCLTFLQKVSVGTQATATRGDAMQAKYLSEAAADHATWRLLNEPSFPASETVYYMHSKGDGRYGYKVRKPTLTKFATVATVGAVGNVVRKNSYVQYLKPYDIITVYEPNGGLAIPVFRQLLGATFVDPADTLNLGTDDSQWVVLKGCPTRKEILMGTLDSTYHIKLAVWDGSTWGDLSEFSPSTGSAQYQCYDVAYESLSGDALVVGQYDNTGSVRYNVWNGSSWAFGTPQEHSALLAGGINPSYIDMASNPSSDEILIAEVDLTNDLKVVQWDGAAFNDQGEIDADLATDTYGSAEVVYEQQSGDALILWNHKNQDQIYYSVWSGASLSPVSQLPDFGSVPFVIRAAADPKSDHIFVAAVDKLYDLNVAVWDGDSWIDSREIDPQIVTNTGQVLDVAWEQSGEDVVVAWQPWGTGYNIRYFSWRKGTALADHSVQVGPDVQNSAFLVRLLPISDTEKITLLVENNNNDLLYSLWTGNTLLGDPPIVLESNLGQGSLPFDMAESGVTPYTGGSG
jgi:hypothetical protein